MASRAHRRRLLQWRLSRGGQPLSTLDLSVLTTAELAALTEAMFSTEGLDDEEILAFQGRRWHPFSKRNLAAYVQRHLRGLKTRRARQRRAVAVDRVDEPFLNFLRKKA